MTYFIVQEEDYKVFKFDRAQEIKSEGIKKAIQQYIHSHCWMDINGDDVVLYVCENQKPLENFNELVNPIMKYVVTCEVNFNVEFLEYL